MLSAICGASATIKCPSLTKVRLPSEVTYLEEGPTGNQCNSERCQLPTPLLPACSFLTSQAVKKDLISSE